MVKLQQFFVDNLQILPKNLPMVIALLFLGINIVPTQDPFTPSADMEGPSKFLSKLIAGTPYENGVFRCILKIDEEFPQKPPKGYFLTKIFHPNISPLGEICVNILKKDWDPVKWSLRNIFEVIRCLLIVPFPESSLNEEAGKLFMESYDEYAKTARVYCSVYAKKEIGSSENKESPEKAKVSPEKEGGSDMVLGSITLNPQSEEHKAAKKAKKTHTQTAAEKKKWIKRI